MRLHKQLGRGRSRIPKKFDDLPESEMPRLQQAEKKRIYFRTSQEGELAAFEPLRTVNFAVAIL